MAQVRALQRSSDAALRALLHLATLVYCLRSKQRVSAACRTMHLRGDAYIASVWGV